MEINRSVTAIANMAQSAKKVGARAALQAVNVKSDGTIEAADGFLAAWTAPGANSSEPNLYSVAPITAVRSALAPIGKSSAKPEAITVDVEAVDQQFPKLSGLAPKEESTTSITLAVDLLKKLIKMAKESGNIGIRFESGPTPNSCMRFTLQPSRDKYSAGYGNTLPIFGLVMPMLEDEHTRPWQNTTDTD